MLRALDPDGADPLPHLRASARAGVLVARPNRRFEFAHALLAQAAYQSMLRRTRETLHARIAELLQTRFPEVLTREPGLLAEPDPSQIRLGDIAAQPDFVQFADRHNRRPWGEHFTIFGMFAEDNP